MSGPYDDFTHYPPYYPPSQAIITATDDTIVSPFGQHPLIPSPYGLQPFTSVEGYHAGLDLGQTGARSKRSAGVGGDHVKHRRTRSGCYTCRNRRVKCDEVRPICDRCRKGGRECIYPEPTTSSKAKRRDSRDSKLAQPDSGSSPDGEDVDAAYDEEDDTLSPATTQDAGGRSDLEGALPTRSKEDHQPSSTSALPQNINLTSLRTKSVSSLTKAPDTFSPLTEFHGSPSEESLARPIVDTRWAELPRDLRFYLDFFQANVNKFHYFFKYTTGNWLHTTFLDIALDYEPLLFAVVGFASYHHSVRRRAGKIQDFLRYYNKSVTSLRLSLTGQHTPDIAMLITILQLATIEEYLGDWVSLLSHQRAAFQIIMTIFTPQTAMQTETARTVLSWYLRFDISGAMFSGSGTFLPREWFAVRSDYYRQMVQEQPTNLSALYWDRSCEMALICADAATLWARRARGDITDQEFNQQTDDLGASLTNYRKFSPLLLDSSRFISDFSGAPPRDPDDIVDPYDPNFFFGEPIWLSNLMLLDWWAAELMFKHQLTSMRRQVPPSDSLDLALRMLKMFEAMELYPNKPPGVLIALQASLAVACLFVPNDHRHSMWVRKKLALVEASGFTYPKMFRQKLSDHWGVDLSHWWLPDNEGFPPILGSIRSLIHDRSEGPQRDQMSAAIRDMRGIFDNLVLNEDAPSESPDSAVPGTDSKGKSRSSSVQESHGITFASMEY